MAENRPKVVQTLAVFIDADNLNDPTALDHVLKQLGQRAERTLYKRAYGRPESLKTIEAVLWRHGVRPVANMIVNKVTTDSALVIDAVEAVCTNNINAVAICSGDADFVPLATWLREKGCHAWCYSLVGRTFANPESFYDEVIELEVLEPVAEPTPALLPAPSAHPTAEPNKLSPEQQVLRACPQLRDGQTHHLNQVVRALRNQGVIAKTTQVSAWFAQHGAGVFHLSPQPAPNRIVHGPSASKIAVAQACATPSQEAAQTLRKNRVLLDRLRAALRSVQDDSGWATVSAMRLGLGGKTAFNTRDYGFSTLTKLLVATGLFELRAVGTPQVAVRLVAKSKPAAKKSAPKNKTEAKAHPDAQAVGQILAALPSWLPGTVKQLVHLGAPLKAAELKTGSAPLHAFFRKYPDHFTVLPMTGVPRTVRLERKP